MKFTSRFSVIGTSALLAASLLLAGCDDKKSPPPPPVQQAVVEPAVAGIYQDPSLGCPVNLDSSEMQRIFSGYNGVDGLRRPLNDHGVPVAPDGTCLSSAPVPEVYSYEVSPVYVGILASRYHYTYRYVPSYVHVYSAPGIVYRSNVVPTGRVIVQTTRPATSTVTVPAGATQTVRPGAAAPAPAVTVNPGATQTVRPGAPAPAAAPAPVVAPVAAPAAPKVIVPPAPAAPAPAVVTPPKAAPAAPSVFTRQAPAPAPTAVTPPRAAPAAPSVFSRSAPSSSGSTSSFRRK